MTTDAMLKQSVLDELKWEPRVAAAHIGVTAKDGVISLSGHVGSFLEKRAAEAAAGRVNGVKAVAEEIDVKLPFDGKRGDEEIAAAAIQRLAWDVAVPHDSVKLKVEKGWVTLTGTVEWHYQKEAASADVHGLLGIIGVSNEIKIKPRVNVATVSADIDRAIKRLWFFDKPNRVAVSADGGMIRLTGEVHSWHDREVAGDTAWAAPGAVAVENHIAVV